VLVHHFHEEIACTEVDSTEHPLGLNRSALLVARLSFRNQRFVYSDRGCRDEPDSRPVLVSKLSQEVCPVSHCVVVHAQLILNGHVGQLDRPIIYHVDQRTQQQVRTLKRTALPDAGDGAAVFGLHRPVTLSVTCWYSLSSTGP